MQPAYSHPGSASSNSCPAVHLSAQGYSFQQYTARYQSSAQYHSASHVVSGSSTSILQEEKKRSSSCRTLPYQGTSPSPHPSVPASALQTYHSQTSGRSTPAPRACIQKTPPTPTAY